ncbi:glycoside hydrolase family 97 N-terminal domain-containing protein [Sphingomonas aerolata]|uniref:glycoside hydrolase family 97 N-terminal domain-containing protein n=1 Tax=Sphingomonas aerolata TaxID=185951 RepID=UPI003365252C
MGIRTSASGNPRPPVWKRAILLSRLFRGAKLPPNVRPAPFFAEAPRLPDPWRSSSRWGEASFRSLDGRTEIVAGRLKNGGLAVRIRHDDRDVVAASDVGLRPEGDAYGPMIIEGSEAVVSANDDEARHGELLVRGRELNGGKRAFLLRLRAYDPGAAFRLEIPAEPREGEVRLSSETTALRFPRDHACRERDVSITGSRHRPSPVELDRRAGIEVGFV